MRLPLLISLSLLFFSWQPAGAQLAPADDFFHSGAQIYISNNIPQAKEVVEMGRKLYPDDDKLKKLEELLKQQSQQQQKSQDQQKQDEQKQKPSESKKDEQKKPPEQPPSSAEKKSGQENQSDQEPAAAGQMTPAEAKKILDAQKGDEQLLQFKPEGKPRDTRRPVKDW
jgi:outer membrane biosynthesis protein TonB